MKYYNIKVLFDAHGLRADTEEKIIGRHGFAVMFFCQNGGESGAEEPAAEIRCGRAGRKVIAEAEKSIHKFRRKL